MCSLIAFVILSPLNSRLLLEPTGELAQKTSVKTSVQIAMTLKINFGGFNIHNLESSSQ